MYIRMARILLDRVIKDVIGPFVLKTWVVVGRLSLQVFIRGGLSLVDEHSVVLLLSDLILVAVL
jgi:hypothetical protein